VALAEAALEVVWLQKLNSDVFGVIYEDNQSAICITKSQTS